MKRKQKRNNRKDKRTTRFTNRSMDNKSVTNKRQLNNSLTTEDERESQKMKETV